MTLVQLIVLTLATWRIASLLSNERGPFDVFVRIRGMTGITHDENKKIWIVPDDFFALVVSCVWCNSVYIATFWVAMYYFFSIFAFWGALPFALSAGAIFLSRYNV